MPIRRTAAFLAGHGFVVAVPEVYHELMPGPGVVLAYDQAGADQGNAMKIGKRTSSYDSRRGGVRRSSCSRTRTASGRCRHVGHLHRRPPRLPRRLHQPGGGSGGVLLRDRHPQAIPRPSWRRHARPHQGSESRAADDLGPSRPAHPAGRPPHRLRRPDGANVTFTWHEVTAQHAFIRDEGSSATTPTWPGSAARWGSELLRRKLRH